MALAPGTRLGAYEILTLIGSGGMGEVYRATDTKLHRDVAIKVLPSEVAAEADRLARFEREAQVLASLNHPNIAHIHGIEDSTGAPALVMELVEGPTLADRIAKGPIPLDEALPIAKQIAEALEAAHEQGIIHRDLKPANIKVRPDGTVKVLDFGLAKAFDPMTSPATNATMSPTLSMHGTQGGVILGTAAYMSPEQAAGKAVDKRTDLWSFGVVLAEMLSGRPVFAGETVSHVLASVLKTDPDWTTLPASTPTAIRRLLRRCLEKDRKRRLDSAAAARLEIDDAFAGALDQTASPISEVGARQRQWRRASASAATAAIAALLAGASVWMLSRPSPSSVVRTTITTSGATALTLAGPARDIAITPDGSRIVYRGNRQLLVQPLDQLEPKVLSGLGERPNGPFVSPDGQWIGFFGAGTALNRVAVTGGPPITIAHVDGAGTRGATWGPDGTIIFATGNPTTGLLRVPAAGGDPMVLTTPDRERGVSDHWWPEFLPGGKAVLFTVVPVRGGIENAEIAVLDLRTGTSKLLIRGGSHAYYVPTGHLVYGVAGTLRAVAFDLGRLEVVGTSAPVLEGVVTTLQGAAEAVIAANGSLVYVPGRAGSISMRTVASVDRQGHASPLPGVPPDSYGDVRVSPDGTRLALATADDVWIYDIARATLSRLTTDPAVDIHPLWTPDGRRIVFTSERAGYREMFWRPADRTGGDERLLTRGKDLTDLRADGWSADGRHLLFTEVTPSVECAIGQIPIERPSEVRVLVKNEFCNDYPAVSPDGRWMAYHSNVSGRYEVYVERYPELGDRHQISSGGGARPRWSRDGRTLFFVTPDNRQVMTVDVQPGSTLVAGRPTFLFESAMLPIAGGNSTFDLAPDGRFYILRSDQVETGGGTSNLILVQNWFAELKTRMPLK